MKKNLKKRLAMVLAAAMVFSTPVAVNSTVAAAADDAVTESVDYGDSPLTLGTGTQGWWEAPSPAYELQGDYDVTFNFDITSEMAEAYHTNLVQFFNDEGKDYFVLRGDCFQFGDNAPETKWTYPTPESGEWVDWYKSAMKDANVTQRITRTGNDFMVHTDIKSNVEGVAANSTEVTFTLDATEKMSIKILGEKNVIKINSYKISKNNGMELKTVAVTGPAISAEEGSKSIDYSFKAVDIPEGAEFEVSVFNGTDTVTGSAVSIADNGFTYSYPEKDKGVLESGTYTFKVAGVKVTGDDKVSYVLDGDAAKSVTVEVKDGVITGSEETETLTVKLTDGKAALTADKKSIDYTFKAENAPAKGTFEYAVSKGDAVVATGSAAAVAEVKVNYVPTESGKYSFKVTGVKADESDKAVYVLDGEAAAELDFTVPSDDKNPNPPASNPPASNPPASNPPASNPPAAGTVKKVTVKAQNQKAGTKTVYLKKGGKVTLTATVTGTGKFSKAVTWTSSKKAVATVSSKGVVKAKKAGTAKITAASKTNKAKKATITIKVAKKAKKNKKLTLKARKKNLKKGKTYTVAIKSMTKGTTDAVTYKTNKKKIATVDKFGVVKAKKKGTAVITVKCGSKKAKLTIKVK